ncbi:MAG: exodeoxyribonuclease V subunit beta [Desulfobacterales bacterium]
MKPLDLINTPLEGINLIEASAGTGKTYTIEGLFLRLILERQFQVDQILVVTFTKAATEELKDRIRTKLLQAEKAFTNGESNDKLLTALLERMPNPGPPIALIHDALVNFDRAPIFTIHGFCARILFEHAFETANLFDTELVSDPSEWEQEVAEDFWRRHVYDAPLECVSFLTQTIRGPSSFQQLLGKLGAAEMNIIPQIARPALESLAAFRKAYDSVRKQWSQSRPAVKKALRDPALSGTQYGGLTVRQNAASTTKRDQTILRLLNDMDQYVAPHNTGFPPFKNFEKFTAQKLIASARKGRIPPSHDFFNLCDDLYRFAAELETELQQYLVYLKTRLLAEAPTELRAHKSQKNIQFFDDLLILVKQALVSKSGNPLADAVRQKYRAALVDEFQDTDSVQYEIFCRLFSDPDSLLFMIGDPKQAIYSFRGADIFSYLKAARDAQSKFTLIENWRSEPSLIAAINSIFSNLKRPFLFKDISFEPSRAGKDHTRKLQKGIAPMTIWYLDSRPYSDKGKPVTKTAATRLLAEAVSEEIFRLVSSKSCSWHPGDMAVLVRTNRQARLINRCLSARGLPSVLHSTGNIFDSREAMEIEKILLSICAPDNPGLLKAALAMDMMGARGEDLLATDLDVDLWEDHLIRNREYTQLWQRSGFMQMFQTLMNREHIRKRLLSYTDGERRLTNVLHLAEIIHQESTRRNLGKRGVLKWLAEQRDPQSPRLEEHQLRLESDAHAVNIVTIHKSKGLEYPVVFCPYGWEGSFVKDAEIIFHKPDTSANEQHLTMDLGSDSYAEHLICAQKELLAENIRLLYVALTRAQSKCYLAWGRINTAESSALAYLLHPNAGIQTDLQSADIVTDLKRQVNAKSDADRLADLSLLAKKSRGSIELVSLPEPSEGRLWAQPDRDEMLSCRNFSGLIDTSWKVSSYSALISRQTADIDLPDRDALGERVELTIDRRESEIEPDKTAEAEGIFAFPKGSRAGNFFHDLFEHLDYTDVSSDASDEVIRRTLQAYGFDNTWQRVIAETLSHALQVPLIPQQPELTLSKIDFDHRVNEMEFYFPLNTIQPSTLQVVFKANSLDQSRLDFPLQLQKLIFNPVGGFMKGYMDLVFQHRHQFFLVDWKSNYLGPTIDSYRRDALDVVMRDHFYVLQYHLYLLALCQYLRQRNSAFQYETDFGGVLYLFIRGIDHRRGPECGIYFDRPKATLINALGNSLIPNFVEFI